MNSPVLPLGVKSADAFFDQPVHHAAQFAFVDAAPRVKRHQVRGENAGQFGHDIFQLGPFSRRELSQL